MQSIPRTQISGNTKFGPATPIRTKKLKSDFYQYISVFGKVENRNQWKKLC